MQLSVKDAAALLNVSDETIYKWVKQSEIPFQEINEQVRFNRAELLEWATSRNMQVSPDLFTESEAGKPILPSLTEALKAGGVAYHVAGSDQPAVLRSVVNLLPLPETVDREFLYQVLQARESMGSTGVGNGIAIPHVRNPVVLHVSRPTVTLCFLDTPIDFHAVDGKPVDILFTMISPTVKLHLHLLSRLSFLLRNPDIKAALRRQAPADELLSLLAKAEATIKATSGPAAAS